MTDPQWASEPGKSPRNLADAEWHRLHPATPLLRGGIFILAVIGFVIANLRERLFELFLPGADDFGSAPYDPIEYVVEEGILGIALLGLLALLLVIVAIFYLSWRMHTFRITGEAVEVRSGIIFRTHRQAKLDRVQGVSISRPLLPRIVGAAKMEVAVAGQNSSVKLDYLYSRDADRLRADVLTLASGVRLAEQGVAPAPTVGPEGVVVPEAPEATSQNASEHVIGRIVHNRVNEFLAPELDPNAAPPESVVRIPPGRLVASTLISVSTLVIIALIVVSIVAVVNGELWPLFVAVPAAIGIGSYYVSTITKSLRYSIAGTPAGVRVGFGLISTSNDTIPPGRVHAVRISQPALWRLFGWWQVKINKAGLSAEAVAGGKGNTTVLPVGTLDDVARVLELMLDGVQATDVITELRAVITAPQSSGFVIAPRRAMVIDPLAWRRTGFSIHDGLLLLRRGVLWRKLDLVPLARLQSFAVTQGPVERMLRLASVQAHTVLGPISPRLHAVDFPTAENLFERVSGDIVEAVASDHSHRWAQESAPARVVQPKPSRAPEPFSTQSEDAR